MRLRKNSDQKTNLQKKFKHLALGGTFDLFHQGHRHFLTTALLLADRVTIGITSDEFARQLHSHEKLQSFRHREEVVREFLKTQNIKSRTRIIKLVDVYGTTVIDDSLQALLVTENTQKGAELINRQRHLLKKRELVISVCPLLQDEEGKLIASHRIRNGEINREGRNYYRLLQTQAPYRLPRALQDEFRKPFGATIHPEKGIYASMKKAADLLKKKQFEPVICVGDVVTHSFLKIGGISKIKIIDLHVERKKRYRQLSEIGPIEQFRRYSVKNPPSCISLELVDAIHQALEDSRPSVIQIEGEEDLAVLPAVLLAPLRTAVIYGHFKLGIVVVTVTEAKKKEALELITKLIPIGSAKL